MHPAGRRLLPGRCVALVLLVLPPLVNAAETPEARVQAYRDRPLAEKLATPRHTLETLCFAADAYERIPALIQDAVACLAIDAQDGYAPGAAELLALQMHDILDELSLPFTAIGRGADGQPVVLYEHDGLAITLARGSDGLWRFDRATVARIPTLRQAILARTRQRNALRAQLREGMEDPTATMTTFLDFAVAGDFHSAAARLDLGHLSPEQRRGRGPLLAWKLACLLQRRGYLFRQEVPVDPEGPPYTWSADAVGRITVERVRQPGGKDTWLFSRVTVDAIDTMWERERTRPPDPRYVLLGRVVQQPPDQPATATDSLQRAPAAVPPELATPRALFRHFFKLMDDAEFDDARLVEASQCLDLSHLPAEDMATLGPKLAVMLEAVLRKIHPDLSALPDTWSAGPQVLNGPEGLRVEATRQADGAWRFNAETVARVPALYASLGGRDKAQQERGHGLGNPREALVTFFRAVNGREDARAAACLDLSELPLSARDDLGPVLAFKLKSVLDHLGRVYLQEIADDPDGPRVVLYRGPLGRIVLARREDDDTRSWRFTAATVRDVEAMYDAVLDRPVDPNLEGSSYIRLQPEFRSEPGVWLRQRLPPRLRSPVLGLAAYQWLGLPLALLLAWAVAWLAARLSFHGLVWLFHMGAAPADRDHLRRRMGALRLLVFLLLLYPLLGWLDLHSRVAAPVYATEKLLLTVALLWAGLQWTDLAYMFYRHSGRLDAHRGLGDLIVPFTRRTAKLAIVLVTLGYLVYEFGQGESLTHFLAGLGLAGLAVSLAAQDSLKNLFATILLIGDRTFRVGDRLLIGDKEGVVEQVGFRSTRLRTPEDSLLVLPNSLLAYGAIDNLGLRHYRRLRATFTVALDTPLEQVTQLQGQLHAYLVAYPGADRDRVHVHLNGITEGGVELEATAYLRAKDVEGEKQCREDLTREILRLAGDLGITLRAAKK